MLLLIVAHPTKLIDGVEPSLYDIAGSAQWYNQADWGVVIHRKKPNRNLITVRSAKIRRQPTCGITGRVSMSFNRADADFYVVTQAEDDEAEAA
jgi:twinkle protein